MVSSLESALSTLAIHSDDNVALTRDVSAPIHVSTTFKYDDNPDGLIPWSELKDGDEFNGGNDVYSRMGNPTVRRAEEVLSKILKGESVLFSSGLGAFHAAMLHYNPKQVFVGDCYHGCHGILDILKRNYGVRVRTLEEATAANVQKGDVVHVETPINPTGIAFDLAYYAKIAHENDAYLLVDATFAPPPLQDPFLFGADLVMHSATKFLGGHSDLLAGVLVTKDPEVKAALTAYRNMLGTVAGSLESWLLLRSLRTFKVRITQQAENAARIVKFLSDNKDRLSKLDKVYHSSLQTEEFVKEQLPTYGSPVFSIELTDRETAKAFPSKLKFFHHATSLGGVESLIEWRRMSDGRVSDKLLRVSIGIEDADDLIADLEQALK